MDNQVNKTKKVVKSATVAKTESKLVYADLIKKIESLKVTELNAFIKELQEYFQVNPAMATASSGSAEKEEKAKSSGLVDLILTETGQGKVAVIKVLAKTTGKGLLEAKKMLDTLPLTVLSQKTEEEATKLQKELQDAGATVEIK